MIDRIPRRLMDNFSRTQAKQNSKKRTKRRTDEALDWFKAKGEAMSVFAPVSYVSYHISMNWLYKKYRSNSLENGMLRVPREKGQSEVIS
jgi:hypothetical protein